MIVDAHYLTVQEAASILNASVRSVYGYISKGQLPVTRVGERMLVKENDVLAFEFQAPGRPRELVPAWHIPPERNRQYMTMITVRVRPGQDEALESRLVEIHRSARHCFFGTSARYVVRNQCNPSEIDLVLVWETAAVKEGQSLLYA